MKIAAEQYPRFHPAKIINELGPNFLGLQFLSISDNLLRSADRGVVVR